MRSHTQDDRDEYADDIAEERHMRAMRGRWCPDCHYHGGKHHPGCPNATDEAEEETTDNEDENNE
jgi:hypothetical protein